MGGEIQLSDAINTQAVTNNVEAVRLNGERFDCGSKVGYLKANIAIGLDNEELSARLKKYIGEIKDL